MSNPRLPTHSRNTSLGEEPQFVSPLEVRSPSSDFNIAFQASLEQQSSMDLGGSHVDIAGAGLGNLADELADAFSDSGDEAEDINEKGSLYNDDPVCENNSSLRNCDSRAKACGSDSVQLSAPAATHLEVHASQQRKHQRKTSDYDGSDYGSSSDFDDTGLSPSIIARLDAVDALARRGAHDIGLQDSDIFTRVTGELRDLASQSSVESSTARLITAHAAIATHLTHQTRQIQGLAFSLLSPMAPSPSSDVVDDVVPLLISLAESVPRPSMVAYESLSALHSMTAELVRTLSYLSDTLHMSRQTTATASRRLRSARDLVAEIRRDDELREEGETWLARGNWGERLQRRECASVCGDVIGGFEAVCNGWRERLAAQERSVA